jgi:hypothetical protein
VGEGQHDRLGASFDHSLLRAASQKPPNNSTLSEAYNWANKNPPPRPHTARQQRDMQGRLQMAPSAHCGCACGPRTHILAPQRPAVPSTHGSGSGSAAAAAAPPPVVAARSHPRPAFALRATPGNKTSASTLKSGRLLRPAIAGLGAAAVWTGRGARMRGGGCAGPVPPRAPPSSARPPGPCRRPSHPLAAVQGGSADPVYVAAAQYLKSIGFTNQAEVARGAAHRGRRGCRRGLPQRVAWPRASQALPMSRP